MADWEFDGSVNFAPKELQKEKFQEAKQLSKQEQPAFQNTANHIVKYGKMECKTRSFTMRLTAYWNLNKKQQNNNQN